MALVSASTVTAGSVLTASAWNTQVAGNMNDLYASRRLVYDDRSTVYNIDQTSLGAATDIFTDRTFTADGTSAYRVEFYVPKFGIQGNSEYSVHLTDGGSTSRLRVASWYRQEASDQSDIAVYAVVYFTPSAGSVTVNLRAFKNSGTNTTFTAGDGTGTNYAKMWFAVYGPALT